MKYNLIFSESKMDQLLKQDRLLSLEPKIIVGVNGFGKCSNPFYLQKIRINDNKLISMTSYHLTPNSLCYEFEKDLRLCFLKRPDREGIYIELKTHKSVNVQQITPLLVKNFKAPSFDSPELDLIESFIK